MAAIRPTDKPSAAFTSDFDLEFRHVTKDFGEVRAVDDATFQVRRGEFLSLLGPSGCGKTTTLRMIAGFDQPSAGEIYLAGRPVGKTPPYRRNVNTVFQHYALFPHKNVFDNIAFGLRMKRLPSLEIADRVGAHARARRAAGHRATLPAPAIRRPAAAGRARARARQRTDRAPARRAAGRPRPEGPPPDAAGAEAHPPRGRCDVRLCHARPGGSADDVRPHRRHEPRSHRAARDAGGDLRVPGDAVCGELHRPDQPARAASSRHWRARPSSSASTLAVACAQSHGRTWHRGSAVEVGGPAGEDRDVARTAARCRQLPRRAGGRASSTRV